MATVRKTITSTDQQDDWIKAQVEGGHYTNDSEYIRDLIRREQERGAEIEAVRAALIEGEKSGKPRRFDASAFTRMAEYRLSPAAERDLVDIWKYTLGAFKGAFVDHIERKFDRLLAEQETGT
jgi:antitoxin ParD1/3/4